jgi:putative transposase
MDYRHGSHTTFAIHLHLIWITTYRKKVLRGEVAIFVRDIIREECSRMLVDILKGYVSKDHVHLLVSIPPR